MTTHQNGNGHRVHGDELFETRPQQQKRREVTLTANVVLDGFPVEVQTTGSIADLPRLVARLKEIGAEPAQNAPVSAQNAPGAPHPANAGTGKHKQAPTFDSDGYTCCPIHNRRLSGPNTYGKLYCTAKGSGEGYNQKGYCLYTIAENDVG